MRYMDYEEFKNEYKKFDMWTGQEWDEDEEFRKATDELLWGKRNGIPHLKLESPHANNDKWLSLSESYEKKGMQKDGGGWQVKPMMGLGPKNNITSTGFIPDDRVNSPSHYTSGRMEAIDIIEDAISTAPTPQKGLLQAQVLKYILRLWLKDSPVEDAKKAEWYLRRLIDSLE